jgi:hypothetical protein
MKGNAPSKITKRTQPGTAEVCSHQLNKFLKIYSSKVLCKRELAPISLSSRDFLLICNNPSGRTFFFWSFAIPVAAYRSPGPLLQIQHGG